MQQAIREIARRCKNQQSFCIKIKTTDREPFSNLHFRQARKDVGASIRIIVAHDFTSRLVIENHARWLFCIGSGDGFAIDTHCVIDANALTNMSRLAIDRYAAGDDQLLHFATRANSGICQHLVKLRHQHVTVQILVEPLLNSLGLTQIRKRLFSLFFSLDWVTEVGDISCVFVKRYEICAHSIASFLRLSIRFRRITPASAKRRAEFSTARLR
jgi:hypothetical protein